MLNLSPHVPAHPKPKQSLDEFLAQNYGKGVLNDSALSKVLENPSVLRSNGQHPRVLFCGTFAAGKTTLFDLLKLLPAVTSVDEAARRVLDSFPKLELLPDFQTILLRIQATRELDSMSSLGQGPVIFDRGFLDIICYSKFFGYDSLLPNLIPFLQYDKVLVFSPNEIDVSHIYGPDWLKFRLEMHAMFIKTLNEAGIPYTLVQGSTPERLRQLVTIFSGHKISDSITTELLTPNVPSSLNSSC